MPAGLRSVLTGIVTDLGHCVQYEVTAKPSRLPKFRHSRHHSDGNPEAVEPGFPTRHSGMTNRRRTHVRLRLAHTCLREEWNAQVVGGEAFGRSGCNYYQLRARMKLTARTGGGEAFGRSGCNYYQIACPNELTARPGGCSIRTISLQFVWQIVCPNASPLRARRCVHNCCEILRLEACAAYERTIYIRL